MRFEYFNRDTSRLSCPNKFLRPRIPRRIFALKSDATCSRIQKTGMKIRLYKISQVFFKTARQFIPCYGHRMRRPGWSRAKPLGELCAQNFRNYGRESLTEMQANALRDSAPGHAGIFGEAASRLRSPAGIFRSTSSVRLSDLKAVVPSRTAK